MKLETSHYWFLQLQTGAAYTNGDATFKDLVSPTVQLACGYQFNPIIGLRLQGSGWESKDGLPSWPGYLSADESYTYKWNYISAGIDLKINLTNLISGYLPERIFNMNLICGDALYIGWNNNAVNIPIYEGYELEYLWDGVKVRPVFRFGLDFDFRCNDFMSINLEGSANLLPGHYNSKKSNKLGTFYNLMLGIKFTI